MPDIRHDPSIFHRVARRHFLERNREVAIGSAGAILEHIPKTADELQLVLGGMAGADDPDDRGDRRWACSHICVITRIRREYRMHEVYGNMHDRRMDADQHTTLFRYTVAFPEFYRFMRQETLTNNPRLKWVAEAVLTPLLGAIAAADHGGSETGFSPRRRSYPIPLYDGQPDRDAFRIWS